MPRLILRTACKSLALAATSLAVAPSWAVTPPCRPAASLLHRENPANLSSLALCPTDAAPRLAELELHPDLLHLAPTELPTKATVLASESAAATASATPADTMSSAFKTSDQILVRAESSYSTIIHEAQIKVSAETIENSAGTFGDPSRYFQLLPGVVSDNDQRNDILVRGGNPSENLFVLDGIVVPSINHLALSNTTGGFVSMIDNDAIESITLHSGVHDAHFADRLSSVIEISTVPESSHPTRRVFEAGLAGIGGTTSRPWGDTGNLLFSGRQSVLNLLTNDIGLNGVPKYTNSLMRGNRSFGERDRIWGVSLTGIDSILIRPDAADYAETSTFNVDYSGWRNTSGLNWQHTFTAKTFGVLTVSNAEQKQNILEADQLLSNQTTYVEHSHEGTSTATFNLTSEIKPWLLATGGVTHSINRIDYNIQQPVPLPNPYSASLETPSVTSILQKFDAGVDSGFLQGTFALPLQAVLTLSARADHWGYGDHTSLTPRGLLSIPVLSHRLALGYAEYTQMPAFLSLLAFPGNNSLMPTRAEHTTADLDLVRRQAVSLTFSAYRKLYFDYPVPAAFPMLSMANVADTFGQSFLMFPLVSGGRGRNQGLELNLESHPVSRLHFNASATYARAWYSGLDGILRRGNFDIPLVVNTSALIALNKGFSLSMRYSGASGRPYTPDNLTATLAQDRDVYDLSQINLARSNPYGRLDFRIEQKRKLRSGMLIWNAGLLNALNQKNFYANIWEPHNSIPTLSQQDQTPCFPEGSVKYVF